MRKYFLLSFIALTAVACNTKKSTATELTSEDFPDRTERIEKLKQEVVFFSEIEDAEFKLVNANGFHDQRLTVPGASFHDYQFVVKVKQGDISKWTKGMKDTANVSYVEDLLQEVTANRKENWLNGKKSVPGFFVRPGENVLMMVFEKEGIVFKWSRN